VTKRRTSDLAQSFALYLVEEGRLLTGDRVIVALSGGVDSLVLLHLLRFASGVPPLELHAAHFDHRMRPESGREALWVGGLCRAWGVSCSQGVASSPIRSEESAREARYRFLVDVFRESDARWILTAHQADDQAETVLFRALRGTGLRGLAGIPRERPPGILRPLLPFARGQIESYARDVGLNARVDPSNQDLRLARNFIRHEILPRIEADLAPGAGRSLRRLAALARENEEAWGTLIPSLMEKVLGGKEGKDVIARAAFLGYHPAVQRRLLREFFLRRGITLNDAGTRAALEFTRTGASGRSFPLPGGSRLVREFDHLVLAADEGELEERPLEVAGAQDGRGRVVVGGRAFEVTWGKKMPSDAEWTESFSPSRLRFPLQLRCWAPGDRVRLSYGSKKLKKLFWDRRVPLGDRREVPILVDARGRVLWVCGLTRSVLALPRAEDLLFFIGLRHVPEG
jgi:tRNA(Ile)-lysidine synthase